jgi:hypothetical protein
MSKFASLFSDWDPGSAKAPVGGRSGSQFHLLNPNNLPPLQHPLPLKKKSTTSFLNLPNPNHLNNNVNQSKTNTSFKSHSKSKTDGIKTSFDMVGAAISQGGGAPPPGPTEIANDEPVVGRSGELVS